MRGRTGRGGAGLAVAVALLTGCSGRPALPDVEPAMTSAVRTVAGSGADVRRELRPRCGPTDEALEGLVLRLVANAPAGAVDVEDAVTELRRDGLHVEVGDGAGAALLAVTSEDGWAAELWPVKDGASRVTATAEVDGEVEDAGGPVVRCG